MITKRDIKYKSPEKGLYLGLSPDGHRFVIARLSGKEWLASVSSPDGDIIGKVTASAYRSIKDKCYELMVDYPNMVRI